MYEHYDQIKHVVEVRFQWQDADEYIFPERTGYQWYLGSLVDQYTGGRLSRLEAMPDTWFIAPRENSETRHEVVWYHE